VSSFAIFQRNQLIYVEFGILYLLVSAGGVSALWFSPLLLIVAPSLFLIFSGLFLLLDRRGSDDTDFSDLVSGNSHVLVRGAALSLLIGLCGSIYLSQSGMNIDFFNSLLLLGTLNILPLSLCLFMRRQPHLLLQAVAFSVLAIPVCLGTLIAGGVLAVPLLFIFCFKRQGAKLGVGVTEKTYTPGEVADIEQTNRQRL